MPSDYTGFHTSLTFDWKLGCVHNYFFSFNDKTYFACCFFWDLWYMVQTNCAWGTIGSFGWLITNTVCNDVCISIVFMLWFITYNYWHFCCCNAWTLERNNSWLEHGNVEMKNMSKHCNMFKQFNFKIFIDLRDAKNCRKNWSLHIELIAHYMYNEKPSDSIKPQITWYEDFAVVMLIFECSILH